MLPATLAHATWLAMSDWGTYILQDPFPCGPVPGNLSSAMLCRLVGPSTTGAVTLLPMALVSLAIIICYRSAMPTPSRGLLGAKAAEAGRLSSTRV